MTDISLVTSNKLEIVESIEQMTLPTAEVCSPGAAVRLDTTTGKWTKSNSTSDAEARVWGLATGAMANIAGMPVTAIRKGIVDGYDLSGLNYDADVYLSTTDGALSDSAVSANEIQTVTISGSPTGGTFTLTLGAQTTGTIAYNASAATVEAALEALSTIGQGNVQVTGSAGGPYTVEFVGALAKTNVAAMTASGAGLTGGTSPSVAVATSTAGVSSVKIGRVIPGTAVNLGTSHDKLLFVDL